MNEIEPTQLWRFKTSKLLPIDEYVIIQRVYQLEYQGENFMYHVVSYFGFTSNINMNMEIEEFKRTYEVVK